MRLVQVLDDQRDPAGNHRDILVNFPAARDVY